MSNIHTIEDWHGKSPQECCEDAMRQKRPFVVGLNIEVSVGDLLMIPDFFVSYPVLRFAKPSEIRKKLPFKTTSSVVCQEPPDEKTEKVTEGIGETVGAGRGGTEWPRDKWGYGR